MWWAAAIQNRKFSIPRALENNLEQMVTSRATLIHFNTTDSVSNRNRIERGYWDDAVTNVSNRKSYLKANLGQAA